MRNDSSIEEKRAEFNARVLSKFGTRYKVLSPYRTGTGKISVKCRIHGAFETTPKRFAIRGQGCPECGKQNRTQATTSTRRRQQYARLQHHCNVVGWTLGMTEDMYAAIGGACPITCNCGHTWSSVPKAAVKAQRCRKCANVEVNKTRHIPIEKRLAAIEFVHDGMIVVIGHNGVMGKFECVECSTLWKTKLALVAGGSSCPTCASRRVVHAPRRIQYAVKLNGNVHYVVGYEAHAIRALLKSGKVRESDINLKPKVFTYTLGGKKRKYIPDFSIGKTIVEVKSMATAGLVSGTKFASFESLKAKAKAVEESGHKFVIMLMKGEKRLRVPGNWKNMDAKSVEAFILNQEKTR